MPENPTDRTPRGLLKALTDWWSRGVTPPDLPVDHAPTPARIAHYAITGKLGQGGMGVVFAARDERLDRTVAVKVMSSLSGSEVERKRFWREARAAASVNHPHICQVYEIGEERGQLFIAMELLEGEALAERLRRGPCSVAEALPIGLEMLAALSALHSRGIVHRDLKPSNVFLTPHGVKLLDFGLARAIDPSFAASLGSVNDLTRSGVIVGTPRYMSPEQARDEVLDGRSDLFAAGAILFEMLAGRPAFGGQSVLEVLHATLHEQPPALTGSPAVAALDRVIRRALAKRASDRPSSADAMAAELRAASASNGHSGAVPALARALTRIVVLPFRVLRPDPETDFLAFSLPDAIATSLSGFGSLTVRSSATASRFATEAPDLKALAVEADVDRVVMGTLLRSGDRLRATAQLVEAPSGTLLNSHEVTSSLGDLFRLQDDLARRVVEALSLPLSGAPSPTPDAPHDARAYEFYLRANELARSYEQLPEACELYHRCLELDPDFAPAWARLGRGHWVIAKYIDDTQDRPARAEAALRRALELNPRLTVAHKLYANFESDTGHAPRALTRLLREAARHGNDAELFAGLVHACRYCGLFDESVAAHREARRLDPNVPTSVGQTLVMMGDVEAVLSAGNYGEGSGDEGARVMSLGLADRRDEARAHLLKMRATRIPAFKPWTELLLAWLERRPADMLAIRATIPKVRIMDDPEAIFQEAWMTCDAGDLERGLELLKRSVAGGYYVAPTLSRSRHFDALRNEPAFQELLAEAVAGRERALGLFREGGGERLLGR